MQEAVSYQLSALSQDRSFWLTADGLPPILISAY